MLPVEWQASAEEDLIEITVFIAEHNDYAAQRIKDSIEQAASRLPEHPYLYRTGLVAGTREMVVHPNYVVVYRVTHSEIQILAVLHSRQQYP